MAVGRQNNSGNFADYITSILGQVPEEYLRYPFCIYSVAPNFSLQANEYHKKRGGGNSYLSERSHQKKNLFHILFNAQIKKPIIEKQEHVFCETSKYDFKFLKGGHLTNTEKKNKFDALINRKVSYYFSSMLQYHNARVAFLAKTYIKQLAEKPDTLASMLVELDDANKTPLDYLFANADLLEARMKIVNETLPALEMASDENKKRILFSKNAQGRLYFHCIVETDGYVIRTKDWMEVFGEKNVIEAIVFSDVNNIKPLHILCKKYVSTKNIDEHFQCLPRNLLQQNLLMQDVHGKAPLMNLFENKNLKNEFLQELIVKYVDEGNWKKLLQLKDESMQTLWAYAIKRNFHFFLKMAQQYLDFPGVLFVRDANGKYPFNLAKEYGDIDTLRIMVDFYSPYPAELNAIFMISSNFVGQHLSMGDVRACIAEKIGTQHLKICEIMNELLNPKPEYYIDKNLIYIKDVVEACVHIVWNRPLPRPTQTNRFSFFSVERYPNLEAVMQGVTPDMVNWYFNKVLPFILAQVESPEQKQYADLMAQEFNTRISFSQPCNVVELVPTFDSELHNRLSACHRREQEIILREKEIHQIYTKTNVTTTNIKQPERRFKDVFERKRYECTLWEERLDAREAEVERKSLRVNKV